MSRRLPTRPFALVLLVSAMALVLVLTTACTAPQAPAAPTAAPKTGAAAPAPTQAAPPAQAAPTQPGAAPTQAAAAPAAAAKPSLQKPPAEVADTITIGYPSNLETIDPQQTRSVLTDAALTLVYETLVGRDPVTMELTPLLATSWKNIDPNTWEFKLREGIKFPNGEDFDADHVKRSMERGLFNAAANMSAKTYFGADYKGSFEVVDKYTVRFKTPQPDPVMPERVAVMPITMVPYTIADMKEGYVTQPAQAIGTGPYRITEHVVGDHTTLERRDDYWGEKPPTKKIIFKIIPDEQTRLAALTRGEIDVANGLPVPLAPLVERDPNLYVYSALASNSHSYLLPTKNGGPLANVKVRQAMNYAVDKETILKQLYNGHGKLLSSPVIDSVPGSGGKPYPYDPAKAKQLLAEAGFPNGFETTLWTSTGRFPMSVELNEAIADYLTKVGIKASTQVLEFGEFNRRAGVTQYETPVWYGFTNPMYDATYPFQRFTPEYKRYEYYIAQGETLDLIRKTLTTFDAKERIGYAQRASAALNEEAAWLYLFQLEDLFGVNKKVKNLIQRPDSEQYFRVIYKEK